MRRRRIGCAGLGALKTALIDYGASNLLSVYRALGKVGADVTVTSRPADVAAAERVILPGVGAFGTCKDRLEALGLIDALHEFRSCERPILGVCVGMQIMFERGLEFGSHIGLGWFRGVVDRVFEPEPGGLSLPHIGWAPLSPSDNGRSWSATILEGLDGAVYFLHSFQPMPTDPRCVLALARYGPHRIIAAVGHDNVVATQFHPEKSGPTGLAVLSRFLAL